jgi:hypothetical protein
MFHQCFAGALVSVQVWANAKFSAVNKPQMAAAISIAVWGFMRVWRFQSNTRITCANPHFRENAAYRLVNNH